MAAESLTPKDSAFTNAVPLGLIQEGRVILAADMILTDEVKEGIREIVREELRAAAKRANAGSLSVGSAR